MEDDVNPSPPAPHRRRVFKGLLYAAAALIVLALLTAVYARLSMAVQFNSDQASQALQGQDLSRGNLLLKGWTLSTITLYIPDLLLYAAVVSVAGLGPGMIHVTNALIYAATLLAAVVLAAGAPGRPARVTGGVITAVLLLAPQPGTGVTTLLLTGSHIGSTLVVVLAFVSVDRAPAGRWGALLTAAVLTAAVFGDGLALIIGVGPLIAVNAIRLLRRSSDTRQEVWQLAGAVLSVPLGMLLVLAVRRVHGFHIYPLAPTPAAPSDVPGYAVMAFKGLAIFFGVDPTGASDAVGIAGLVLHLFGLIAVVIAVGMVVSRWLAGKTDRVSELLVMAMVIDLAAFLVVAHGDTSRYLIPVFVFGAILAGRNLGPVVVGARVRWPSIALAAGYCVVLLAGLGAPQAAAVSPWSAWLIEHNLHSGLGSYWQASSITVETGGKVQVRPILSNGKQVNGYAWESDTRWYQVDQLGDVRFVVYDTTDRQFGIDRDTMESVFGPPQETVSFGKVDIMVWDHNLVPEMTLSG